MGSGGLKDACVACRLAARVQVGRGSRADEALVGCARLLDVGALCPHFGPEVLAVDDWWFLERLAHRRDTHESLGVVLLDCKSPAPIAPRAPVDLLLELELARPLQLAKFGPRRPVVGPGGRLLPLDSPDAITWVRRG